MRNVKKVTPEIERHKTINEMRNFQKVRDSTNSRHFFRGTLAGNRLKTAECAPSNCFRRVMAAEPRAGI